MDESSKNKIFSGISWSFAEKVLTNAVEAIITILLSRILYPEDYGLVGLVQIFITISTIFVTCGLGTALIQSKDIDDEQISTTFFLNLIIGLFLYVILYIFAPYIAMRKGNYELAPIIRVLAIKIPIASVYNIQHSYIKKRFEFKKFFYSSLAGTVAAGVVGVYMATRGYGAWALVVSSLVDQVMDCIILFLTTGWFPKLLFSIKKTKKIIMFGISVFFDEVIGRVAAQLKLLIIGWEYSSEDLAYNTKGKKISTSIIDLTNSSVIRVILPVLSENQNDKEKMKQITKKCLQLSLFILSPLLIGLASTAETFVPLLFTYKWIFCVPFIQIYCIADLTAQINSIYTRVIEASGNGKLLVKTSFIQAAFELLTIVYIVLRKLPAIYFAYFAVLASLFSLTLRVFISKRLIDYRISDLLEDLFLTMLTSFIMGVVVYYVGKSLMIESLFIKMMIQVLLGAIIYISISLITKNKSALYIINMFRKNNNE